MRELLRYAAVGILNTLIGYGVFWVGLHTFGLKPGVANALGYAIALGVAYLLNRAFVFKGSTPAKNSALRFTIAFAIAFLVNQGVLWGGIQLAQLTPEVAQIFAMVVYTAAFFILNKYYVFGASRPSPQPHHRETE